MNEILLKCISTMPEPPKDSKNGHFNNSYASLGSVSHTVKSHLAMSGFSLTQTFEGSTLVTSVWGAGSEPMLQSRFDIPFDKAEGKNYWQVMGQGMTYARRYVLCSMFCLVAGDVDDDAELATWYAAEKRAEEVVKNKDGNPRGPVPQVL